jgi:hypothetical protein
VTGRLIMQDTPPCRVLGRLGLLAFYHGPTVGVEEIS